MFGAQSIGALPGRSRGRRVEWEEGAGLQVAGQSTLVVASGFPHPAVEEVGLAQGCRIGGQRECRLGRGRQKGFKQKGSLIKLAGLDRQTSPAEVGQGCGFRIGLR